MFLALFCVCQKKKNIAAFKWKILAFLFLSFKAAYNSRKQFFFPPASFSKFKMKDALEVHLFLFTGSYTLFRVMNWIFFLLKLIFEMSFGNKLLSDFFFSWPLRSPDFCFKMHVVYNRMKNCSNSLKQRNIYIFDTNIKSDMFIKPVLFILIFFFFLYTL